jgi:hypothetical protein
MPHTQDIHALNSSCYSVADVICFQNQLKNIFCINILTIILNKYVLINQRGSPALKRGLLDF